MESAVDISLLDRARATFARARTDFPILQTERNGKPLVFFDSAASAQKPIQVLDAEREFLTTGYANIHRGVYHLSDSATSAYEAARETIAKFLGASDSNSVIFTRGATEAVNLVAQSFGKLHLKAGDAILLSELEHHANIVPWQLLAEERGLRILRIPVTDAGEWELSGLSEQLDDGVAMVAVSHVSNALGTINPVEAVIAAARERGVPVLLDGAQAVPHGMKSCVETLDCDFYVFSSHKIFGPTGVGVLYAKAEHLERMPPYQGGGDMIDKVSFDGTTFAKAPARFEAGTPHISGAIGLATAIQYVFAFDPEEMHVFEDALRVRLEAGLKEIPGLRIYGEAEKKVSVTSFLIDGVHPHDMATFLDAENICIRAGHHCCQPLMTRYAIVGTARASLAFYNTEEEVDRFVAAVAKIQKFFG
ncbi:MAG: aminotransferase class V-fold PLP-dependent enzyme [Opitutales bacterium]